MRTPRPAPGPRVPGNRSEDLAREALRQVVEHWPGDLFRVSLTVEPRERFALGAVVTLVSHEPRTAAMRLVFGAEELRRGSPAVAQKIRRAHRDWTRRTP